jgi:hypothetical protein
MQVSLASVAFFVWGIGGMALAEIRDSRLYREEFETFEDYCKERWDMSKMHAYRLIGSSEVNDALKSNQLVTLPANEAQARPLTQLETPEAQQEAWEMVVDGFLYFRLLVM